jgi:hypothetical protein
MADRDRRREMMEIDLMVLHLLAGLSCGQKATCGDESKWKIRHKSEESASAHADALNRKNELKLNPELDHPVEAYPCPFCYFWHVGRTMSLEELKTLAQMEIKR